MIYFNFHFPLELLAQQNTDKAFAKLFIAIFHVDKPIITNLCFYRFRTHDKFQICLLLDHLIGLNLYRTD